MVVYQRDARRFTSGIVKLSSIDLAAWTSALTQLESEQVRSNYRHDIAAWARDRLGAHLWSKQVEIAESVIRNRRTAVQSAAGIGKSFLASVIALWWIDTHPPGEAIVVTTAPDADLVYTVLWEEIRKHHTAGGLPGVVQRGNPVRWVLDDGTLVGLGRKPSDYATSSFQGIHRKYVLVILDEAGGCKQNLWVGAEAITTNEDCRVLAIGNPDDNSSHFADVCTNDKGLWHNIKVSAFHTPNFTGETVPDELRMMLPSRQQVEDLRIDWGEENPLYIAKVLGEFADADSGLIPLSWINAAQTRWREWKANGSPEPAGRTIWSCDVARFGKDKTAIAERKGHVVYNVESFAKLDTATVADICRDRVRSRLQSTIVVDADGLGGPLVDFLRRDGISVFAYSGAERTNKRDRSGKQRFKNTRSAAYWNMRELLDPAFDSHWCLPDVPGLAADLAAPKWPDTTGNVIQVEEKANFAKRLNRSPDIGDAIVMSAWIDVAGRNEDDQNVTLKPLDYAVASEWRDW